MRFDDMLATVLARPADRPVDRVAQWRQLLDLLAQHRPGSDPALAREALARLQALRRDVPVAIRREIASAFAGRALPPPLLVFLAGDVPVVAGALLAHARLSEEDWLAVLPRLTPTGRGFLRYRRDLGFRVERALHALGKTDFALAQPEGQAAQAPAEAAPAASEPSAPVPGPAALEHGAGEGQIRAIIDRIATFRERREVLPPPAAVATPTETFRFETGPDGLIRWVDATPRGPLIGETIATPSTGPFGVDGQAPGAFRRRAPFRGARLTVAGQSPVAGAWRIAGVPVFDPVTGRFGGYRGSARRPHAHEQADEPDSADALYGAGMEADSMRQLVHELRTPLNAIGGFAEMIRRQMRGPVATAYRDRAQAIVELAGRLLAAVDDLDVAARLETRRLDLERVEVDWGAMVGSICAHHAEAAARRGATLACAVAPGLPPVSGDPAALRRMAGRLLAACGGLADEGETLHVALDRAEGHRLELRVDRPDRLAGLPEAALYDPAATPEGEAADAPLLGLGFSLHLVRRLAAAAGGALRIEAERFVLDIPAGAARAQADAGP